jgi:hypothetical protein
VEYKNHLTLATTLLFWGNWKERNGRIFNKKSTMSSILVAKIKEEGLAMVAAGVKHFAQIIL